MKLKQCMDVTFMLGNKLSTALPSVHMIPSSALSLAFRSACENATNTKEGHR